MFTVKALPSGLRVLTAPSDGTASVTVLVFAGAGSRYEEQSERGISHFLEHMFFKGGKKYKNTKEVSAAIDGVGGDFNAFTGKEYAGYYVKVASEHTDLACDVLGDMLLNAKFPQADIERERGVIMEEERMYQDTPMYRAGWDFESLLFGDNPLGWDMIGVEKVIKSVGQKDFQSHKDCLYTPDNLVVTFAGKIGGGQAAELTEKYFSKVSGSKGRNFKPFKTYGKEKVFLRTKNTEQAHLVFGVPGCNSLGNDFFTQKLLAIILGGNMSSRMFLNIREAMGLCYYISTEDDAYLDAGSFLTRAGVDQTRLYEAIEAIKAEYALFVKGGVTDEELTRSNEFIKGKIILGMEDSEDRAHFFGKQELLFPRVRTVEEYLNEFDAVTGEEIDALARKLLKPEEFRLAVIGKEKNKEKLEELIGC